MRFGYGRLSGLGLLSRTMGTLASQGFLFLRRPNAGPFWALEAGAARCLSMGFVGYIDNSGQICYNADIICARLNLAEAFAAAPVEAVAEREANRIIGDQSHVG